jgi:hypothetical protein
MRVLPIQLPFALLIAAFGVLCCTNRAHADLPPPGLPSYVATGGGLTAVAGLFVAAGAVVAGILLVRSRRPAGTRGAIAAGLILALAVGAVLAGSVSAYRQIQRQNAKAEADKWREWERIHHPQLPSPERPSETGGQELPPP